MTRSVRRSTTRRTRLGVEQLETRTLLSAGLSGLVFQTVDSVDPSQTTPGAGVAGVVVTAVGKNTGTHAQITTGKDGTYSLTGLTADTYTVTLPQLPSGYWGFNAQSFSATVALTDGETFTNLNFALTPTTTSLTQNLYQRVLVRSADAPGLASWDTALNNHSVTLGQAFASFAGSPEFQSNVLPLAKILAAFEPGQPVDPNLLRHNMQLERLGITSDAAVLDILYSPDFVARFGDTSQMSNTQFVTFLYQQLLHRAPDQPGLQAWSGLLNNGSFNRGQVVLAFTNTPEFGTDNPGLVNGVIVSEAYLAILGRPAEQAGYQAWLSALNGGQVTVASLGNAMAAGTEFHSLKGFPDVFLSDVQAQPLTTSVSLLSRLQQYDPTTQAFDQSVAAGGISGKTASGKPADLYVIAHGWAPGFLEDVLLNSTPGNPLKVWQTVDHPGGGTPPSPDSPWLFSGVDKVSLEGVAQSITDADPNAVVLVYSWIDQSATWSGSSTSDPTELLGAGQSESFTEQNGLGLAQAVQQALAPSFFTNQGLIHLLGHSHGSKVATVGALALQQAGVPVTQLTTWESPESGPGPTIKGITLPPQHFAGLVGAQNFLWYYMQQMNVNPNTNVVTGSDGRTPVGPSGSQIPGQDPTYIDNYYSQDGVGASLENFAPATSIFSNPQSLSPIADVLLHPEILYPLPTSPSSPDAVQQVLNTLFGSHDYPPPWYAQASISPTATGNGLAWSPLLNPKPTGGGPGLSEQDWTTYNFNQQFHLAAKTTPSQVTPIVTPLQYADLYQVGAVSDNGTGTITLGTGGSPTPLSLLATTFLPLANNTSAGPILPGTGLSFKFQFQNPAPGDQLVVWVRGMFNLRVPPISQADFPGFNSGTLGYQTVPLFTMNAADAGTATHYGTISLDILANQNSATNNFQLAEGLLGATQQPVLGFSLIHADGSQSSVTVSQLQQFNDGSL